MDITVIRDSILKLNSDWFEEKKIFFLKEGLYNKNYEKVFDTLSYSEIIVNEEGNYIEENYDIVLDIDLPKYCWYSFFYGSYGEQLLKSEEDFYNLSYPIDGEDIADDILRIIYSSIAKFTDAKAIRIVIEKVITIINQTTNDLKNSSVDGEYKKVLDAFIENSSKKINAKFLHVTEQIDLLNSSETLERKISLEVCSKITNFKINNKKLITSVSGEVTVDDALFYLLNSNAEKKSNIKLIIEDWINNDVYYLISRLSEIITDKFSIADIERKKVLYLKTGKLFSRTSFDTFRSQKLEIYKITSRNKSSIDSQLASLF